MCIHIVDELKKEEYKLGYAKYKKNIINLVSDVYLFAVGNDAQIGLTPYNV